MEQNNHEQGRIARVLLAAVAVAILILLICNIAQQTGSSDPSAAAQASASPEESATPEPTGEPQTDAVAEAQRLLDGMSTREKICQLLIVFPEQYLGASDGITTVTPELVQMLEEYPVSGMLLSLQNMTDADQLLALTSGLQAASRFPLILCVDEEGGDVARLMEKVGTTKLHSMYSYRDQGPDVARANGRTLGQDLARFGFNTDLAPVADVWSNPENKVIGTRAYSDDFGEAAALVAAAVQGFHDSGCICCLKHFPGHGSTRTDTHKEAAFVDATLDELRENEFLPFQSGIDAGADMVMVGHLTVPAIDDVPAVYSRAIVTDLLRGELGFEGVIITDGLEMTAAGTESDGAKALRALNAGCDLLLGLYDIPGAVHDLEQALASGALTEEELDAHVLRVLTLKVRYGLVS